MASSSHHRQIDNIMSKCHGNVEHVFSMREGKMIEFFTCQGCGVEGRGTRHKCMHCEFKLDQHCYETRIALTCHVTKGEHKFGRGEDILTPFWCDGCKEMGTGVRFTCISCKKYALHQKCHSPPRTIAHEWIPGHIFRFDRRQPEPLTRPKCVCSPCGRVVNGFAYESKDLKRGSSYKFLHPLCGDTKAKVSVHGTYFHLCDSTVSDCLWCKKKKGINEGWAYVSKCGKFNYHLGCLTGMVARAWRVGHLDKRLMRSLNDKELDALAEKMEKKDHLPWKNVLFPFLSSSIGVLLGNPHAFRSLADPIFDQSTWV